MTGDRRVTHVVESSGAGVRLDQWLAQRLPDLSRMRVQALIAAGRALVDGRAVKAAHRVQTGERVEVAIPPPPRDGLEPEAVPLRVVFEDVHVLVVDKPAW